MNVLSLFDGMSCGRIALERAGLPVTSYFAAEIDKYAVQVSKANWNNIKYIGDVTRVKDYMLPEIDLLIGGSPCQGFSFAGKQLNFSDPRSALFFEFVRLLKECKPKWFLLENVVMKKEYQAVITEALGVQPILINSALVSAQNRKRLYWTNIPFYGQPRDKGILLKHVLEDNCEAVLRWQNSITGAVIDYNKGATLRASPGTDIRKRMQVVQTGVIRNEYEYEYRSEKAMCLDANYYKGVDNHGQRTLIKLGNVNPSGNGMDGNVYSAEGKSPALTTNKGEGSKIGIIEVGNLYEGGGQNGRIYHEEGKSPSLRANTGGLSEPKIYQRPRGFNKGGLHEEKSPPISSNSWQENNKLTDGIQYRKLTPVECERLQTVPDNYTVCVSNTQRYKMLGNGWNIDTIVHLLKPLKYLDIL